MSYVSLFTGDGGCWIHVGIDAAKKEMTPLTTHRNLFSILFNSWGFVHSSKG